jgi:hypothetical protein
VCAPCALREQQAPRPATGADAAGRDDWLALLLLAAQRDGETAP